MSITIREMKPQDYDAVLALWQTAAGVGLSAADSTEHIGQFLARNPGLSHVALADGEIVGAVLCGHDGRRGYIHHLGVAEVYRCRGIGRQLAQRCLTQLQEKRIMKCHLFVFADNHAAREFWRRLGWQSRTELAIMSQMTAGDRSLDRSREVPP